MSQDNDPKKPKSKTGYKTPPEEHQFKKGQSGNPKGRPKGARNKLRGQLGKIEYLLLTEASRELTVQDNGVAVSMPTVQTAMRTLGIKAAKGDVASARLYINLVKEAEQSIRKRAEEEVTAASLYKEIETHYIKYCKSNRIRWEMPIPHPDYVVIDWNNLSVSIEGPHDKLALKYYKAAINIMVGMEVELNLPRGIDTDNPKIPAYWYDDREFTIKWLDKFRKNIPLDDPLWLEYSPGFREKWIDYFYYYGPDPHIPEESLISQDLELDLNDERPALRLFQKNDVAKFRAESKGFRKFMREYLEWYMQDDWYIRLSNNNHVRRDIEIDKNIYQEVANMFAQPDADEAPCNEFELFYAFDEACFDDQREAL